MKLLFPYILLATFPLYPLTARAHHGQEFFLLNDARVQAPGSGLFQTTFSFADEGYEDSLSLSPGLVIGVLPRTALSVIADFADEEGKGWTYRSVEPSVLLDLTPKNLRLPVRFGISLGYQFAENPGESSAHQHGVTGVSGATLEHAHLDSSAHRHAGASQTAAHDHSSHSHVPAPSAGTGVAGTTPPTSGESNPDALTAEEIAAMEAANANASPPAPAPRGISRTTSKNVIKCKSSAATTAHAHQEADGHSHSHADSIHNHDSNLFTCRIAFEADLTKTTLLVGNLICSLPEEGSAAWGYGIGLRQKIRAGLAVGVEALGDFDPHGYQEALAAVYWEPMHHLTLKAGVGTGLSTTSPDATLRAGLVWMF